MAFPHLFATPELTAFGLATGVMLACMVGDMLMSTFYTLTWKGGTMDDGGGAGEFSSVVARVAFTWEGLIAGHARPGGFPVQSLLDAMAVQSASSNRCQSYSGLRLRHGLSSSLLATNADALTSIVWMI